MNPQNTRRLGSAKLLPSFCARRAGGRNCDPVGTRCRASSPVAQICNLPYRRFAIGNHPTSRRPPESRTPAGCRPAIRQIKNLRYAQPPEEPL